MRAGRETLRLVLVIAILASTVAFGAASWLENAGEREEGHDESDEAGGHREAVNGVDYETPAFIALGVVTSLALAALAWFLFARRSVLVLVAMIASAFVALDVREVWFQAAERAPLAGLAAVVAVLHAAVVVLALVGLRNAPATE